MNACNGSGRYRLDRSGSLNVVMFKYCSKIACGRKLGCGIIALARRKPCWSLSTPVPEVAWMTKTPEP
jgi:hypothetical protein